jgi:hypothetical protein
VDNKGEELMAKYAAVFVAAIGDTGIPTQTSYRIFCTINVRDEGNVIEPITVNVYVEATDTVNEVNRKIIEGAQAEILSQLGLSILTRNILLLAGAV